MVSGFLVARKVAEKNGCGDLESQRSTSGDVKDLFKNVHGASTVPGCLGFLLRTGQWAGWLEISGSLDGTCRLKSEDDPYWEGLANTSSWVASKHA